MSIAGVLLTLLVTLLVFNPAKLPKLAYQVGKLLRQVNGLKIEFMRWMQQLEQEQQYLKNQKKAERVDVLYQTKDHIGSARSKPEGE